MTRLALVLPAAFLALTACGGDVKVGGSFAGTIDTLANGAVVTRSPEKGMWTAGEEWTLVEEMRIGSAEEEGPELFGEIRDVEVDAAGRIYVADAQANEVRLFGPDGRHVRTIGRKGGGPGEFQNVGGLMLDPRGRLWVVDQNLGRFSVFDTAGTYVTSHRRSTGMTYYTWPGGMDASGRVYDMDVVSGQDVLGGRYGLVRLDGAMQVADTFRMPKHQPESFDYQSANGQVRMRASVPFVPVLVWSLGRDGNVWVGLSDRYRIARIDARGDTQRVVEREHTPVPVTSVEKDTAVARLVWFTRQGGKVDASRIPPRKSAFAGFWPDDSGRLWVLPFVPGAEQGRQLDVFDEQGRYLGRLPLPAKLTPHTPFVAREDRVYTVVKDDDDVPYVVRYRIQRGAPKT